MQIVFNDDFDHGLEFSPCGPGRVDHWQSFTWQKGAEFGLVDYPGRGQVFKAWVSGQRFLENGSWWRRAQISWGNGCYNSLVTTPAPCAVSCDIWVSDAFAFSGAPGLGLLSIHTPYTKSRLPGYSAGLEAWSGSRLVIGHHDDTGHVSYLDCDAVQMPHNQWLNLMLLIERDGRVLPFFNGTRAIQDPSKALVIYPGFDIGLGDTHAGLYGGNPTQTPDWAQGTLLYNDNFKVINFPSSFIGVRLTRDQADCPHAAV